MIAAPCNGPALAYNLLKAPRKRESERPPHRQRGIFMPAIRPGLRCSSPAIGEWAGGTFRKAVRRSQMRFPKPACSPAQSRFQTVVGD